MLKKITENVEIHQTLPDIPNLTSEELKKEWDKGSRIIKQVFNELIDELNENLYPIGFRMFVNNDTDYTNHLGFTWKKVAKGRVLVGKDEDDTDFNELGKTGGEKTHILTLSEMPQHNHSINTANGQGNMEWGYQFDYGEHNASYNGIMEKVGGSKPHNNMQPYEVVNIWERIS